MFSETESRKVLEKFNEKGGALNLYESLRLFSGDIIRKQNGVGYLNNVGFLEHDFSKGLYKLTDKGLKLLKKEDEDMVNKGKSDKILKRENMAITFLKNNPNSKLKAIGKYLGVNNNTAYQTLRYLENDGEVVVRKNGRKNVYRLASDEKESDEHAKDLTREKEVIPPQGVIIHKPREVLNHEEENGVKMTIGQVLDLVWNKSTSVECEKQKTMKGQRTDFIMARFKDQKTLLEVRDNLPDSLKDAATLIIEPTNKKNNIFLPIPS